MKKAQRRLDEGSPRGSRWETDLYLRFHREYAVVDGGGVKSLLSAATRQTHEQLHKRDLLRANNWGWRERKKGHFSLCYFQIVEH